MKNRFHIHIDAEWLDPQLESYLLDELGFWPMDFERILDSGVSYAPERHLTIRLDDPRSFNVLFESIEDFVSRGGMMRGYIEGEYIPRDIDIPLSPFDPTIPKPFRLEMGALAPGSFRETEIHITLDRDRSDPRILEALRYMGFYSAYMKKPYGMAEILTVQGSRTSVDPLVLSATDYLMRAGGAIACSLKEERIAKWWVSDNDIRLPPVIVRVLTDN